MKTITRAQVEEMYYWSKGSIYDAYGKPSPTKVAIYNGIANRPEAYRVTVRSRNGYVFTAMYENKEGTALTIVYPTHEEVYQIV